MLEILHEVFNPKGAEFYVLVALVVFLAIVWKVGGFSQFAKGLDSRGERIQRELDEAKALREEAEALLADYQRRRKEAEIEAEAMITAARTEAERLRADSIAKAEEFVARRTKLAEQKIGLAEAQALAEVRAVAAEAAVKAASSMLAGRMQGEEGAKAMAAAIAEVTTKLN